MDGSINYYSDASKELLFLISQFLNHGPCKETAQVLEKEMKSLNILPVRYDYQGNSHYQSLEQLSNKFQALAPDTLLKVCERLRDINQSKLSLGKLIVPSLLSGGRYGLLQDEKLFRPFRTTRLYARRRGCPLPLPAETTTSQSRHVNIALSLESRRMSGPLSRQNMVWPKIFHKMQLLNTTVGHSSAVYCVLFDRTGKIIFTGADDLLVKVWSTVTGRLLATLRGPSSEITDMAINPENTILAAGSLDRMVYVWCLKTTALVSDLSAPVGMITGVNFCPKSFGDFRYLASTSSDGSVAFWIYTHDEMGKTNFLGNPVLFNEKMRPGVAQMICSSFSPGGTFLAAGSADHHVRVYYVPGLEGPRRIMEEEAHTDRVDSIQWANNGLRFVSGSKDGTALIWKYSRQKWTYIKLDTSELPIENNEKEIRVNQKPRVSMVSWDRSDKWIVTANYDTTLKVWDSYTGAFLRSMKNHSSDVFVLEPHPTDEGIMLSAGHDGLLCIWDIRMGLCVFQHKNLIDNLGHGALHDAKWSPDGTMIVATDSHGHILLFSFGAANQRLKELPRQMFFNTDYWSLLRNDERVLVDETSGLPPHLMPAPFLVDIEGNPYAPQFQKLVPGREHMDFSPGDKLTTARHGVVVLSRVENMFIGRYYNSTRITDRDTPSAWQTRMLLSPLHASVLERLRNEIDALAHQEKSEFDMETKRPAAPPPRPPEAKVKLKKKGPRRPLNYQTRAAADENQFINPDELSLSSNVTSGSSASCPDTDFDSHSSSSSEYSDWIADHGVSLEPPKRAKRRRRRPVKLSPSHSPRRKPPRIVIKPILDQSSDHEQPKSDSSDVEEENHESQPEIKEVPPEFIPPKWLSEVVPRKAPYYPQMGDHVMFFQEGYRLYLEAVRKKQVYKPSTRDSFAKLGLFDPVYAQVIGIKYEIRPPRLCCLRLAVMNENGVMSKDFFNIKYHDMPDVIDFLVLKQIYDLSMNSKWKPGDRFRCMIDDAWWLGGIESVVRNDAHPDSPFLTLMTKWDNGEDEPMSPWDLEPVDPDRIPSEHGGSIDVLPEETLRLLYCPSAEEWPGGDRDGVCDDIIRGFEKVMSLAMAEAFSAPVDLNLYPTYAIAVEYPIDLSTIKARLENRFYRRLTSVQFDVRYLATNAEKFNDCSSVIVRNARIITDLCLRIIKEPAHLDVMGVYHQLTEGYQSSDSSEDEEEKKKLKENGARPLRTTSSAASAASFSHVNWKGDCERLLRELISLPDASPFKEPVDIVEFPDYAKVVDRPMDLGTVREELMAGNYNTPKDFIEDVRLIFNNSRSYNTNKRSRIYAMSIRLSNLFEARISKLLSEWRITKKRRERLGKGKEKMRVKTIREPQPGSSRQMDSDSEGDPIQVDDLAPLKLMNKRVEERLRLVLSRQVRVMKSDSDDDTDLSTLRTNLKRSGSESRGLLDDSESQSRDIPRVVVNGVHSSSEDSNQVLATIKGTGASNGLEINGHSYAKLADDIPPVISSQVNGINNDSDTESSQEKIDPLEETNEDVEVTVNGDVPSIHNEEENNGQVDSASSWSGEDEADGKEVESGSESSDDDSASSSDSTPVRHYHRRRKSSRQQSHRQSRRPNTRYSSRKTRKTSSEESLEGRLQPDLNDSGDPSSDDSQPLAASSSRQKPRKTRFNTNKMSTESEDSQLLPRKKRRKRKSSGSENSAWSPSDNSVEGRSRTRPGRARRPVAPASSESEEEVRSSRINNVSSRGRVRKMTERARAAFRRNQ